MMSFRNLQKRNFYFFKALLACKYVLVFFFVLRYTFNERQQDMDFLYIVFKSSSIMFIVTFNKGRNIHLYEFYEVNIQQREH